MCVCVCMMCMCVCVCMSWLRLRGCQVRCMAYVPYSGCVYVCMSWGVHVCTCIRGLDTDALNIGVGCVACVVGLQYGRTHRCACIHRSFGIHSY